MFACNSSVIPADQGGPYGADGLVIAVDEGQPPRENEWIAALDISRLLPVQTVDTSHKGVEFEGASLRTGPGAR